MKRLLVITVLICLLLPSCAYMQTNKNVAELGARYVGAEVKTSSLELYSRAGEWYLAAPKVLLERHYPVFHDTIYFDRNNDPTESVIGNQSDGSKLYMPISAGTATVLQRTDGYAPLATLIQESREMGGGRAVESLPGATRHNIRAHVETKGQGTCYYVLKREPEKPGAFVKCLSTLDKYTVDVVGTLVYNVAIPVMAPFRFFSEFLTED